MKNRGCLLVVFTVIFCVTVFGGVSSGAEISGKVVPEGGSYGVDGAVTVFMGDPCNSDAQVIIGSGEISMSSGEYLIVGLPTGKYYLSAQISLIDNLTEWWAGKESSPHCSKAKMITVEKDDVVTGIDFMLDPAASLAGRVSAGQGMPLRDALVEVYSGAPCGSHRFVASNATSSNGRYLIGGLSSGYYFLKVQPKKYLSKWWAEPEGTVECNKAQSIGVSKGATLSGKDFNHKTAGAKITGTTMDVTEDSPTVYPDVTLYAGDPCGEHQVVNSSKPFRRTSSYTISGLSAGTYYIKASGYYTNGDPEAFFVGEWWAGKESSSDCKQAKKLVIKETESLNEINFNLEHGAVISGTVFNAAGFIGTARPVVRAYSGPPCDPKKSIAENLTGTLSGEYSISALSAGTYYLQAIGYGGVAPEWWAGAKSSTDCKMAKPITVVKSEIIDSKDFQLGPQNSEAGGN